MNLLQTIKYYLAYYTLQEPSTKQLILASVLLVLLLAATSCTADYRTDEEVANGVILSEEVKANRKYGRREALRLEEEDAREAAWRAAMNRCGFDNAPIVVCL